MILALGLSLLATHAQAVLVPNLTGDRVETLPRRRFMVSASQFYSTLDHRFKVDGRRESLAENFNRSIPWSEITANDPSRTTELEGLLRSQGVDPAGDAGTFTGTFRGRMHTIVPVVGYGITDTVNLFVAVPIVRFQGEAQMAYNASSSAQTLVKNLAANQMHGASREFAMALNNGFDDQMRERGYSFHRSENRTIIGDTQVVLPLRLSGMVERWRFAVHPMLSIPTGKLAATDDLYRIAGGSGAWTPGCKAIASWKPVGTLELVASASTQVALPHSEDSRVPRQSMDELMRDTEQSLSYGTGLNYGAQIESRFNVTRSWSLRGGLQHQQALKRSVRGTRFDGSRYSILSDSTAERLENAYAALELNTLQAFLDRDFLFPSQLAVGASWPLAGRNTMADPLYLLQVALFF